LTNPKLKIFQKIGFRQAIVWNKVNIYTNNTIIVCPNKLFNEKIKNFLLSIYGENSIVIEYEKLDPTNPISNSNRHIMEKLHISRMQQIAIIIQVSDERKILPAIFNSADWLLKVLSDPEIDYYQLNCSYGSSLFNNFLEIDSIQVEY